MKHLLVCLVGIAMLGGVVGCGHSSDAEPGYSKEDFKKTGPPANWPHGPNGSSSGAPTAPPPPPPSATTAGGK